MKIYVKAAESSGISNFDRYGTGPQGSSNNTGWIKFNAKRSIDLSNGINIYLTTAKVLVNSETGEVTSSMNFEVYAGKGYTGKSFWSYTPEEFTRLYAFLSSLTAEQISKYFSPSDSMFDEAHWI